VDERSRVRVNRRGERLGGLLGGTPRLYSMDVEGAFIEGDWPLFYLERTGLERSEAGVRGMWTSECLRNPGTKGLFQ
jgi:hypothetical protein